MTSLFMPKVQAPSISGFSVLYCYYVLRTLGAAFFFGGDRCCICFCSNIALQEAYYRSYRLSTIICDHI